MTATTDTPEASSLVEHMEIGFSFSPDFSQSAIFIRSDFFSCELQPSDARELAEQLLIAATSVDEILGLVKPA